MDGPDRGVGSKSRGRQVTAHVHQPISSKPRHLASASPIQVQVGEVTLTGPLKIVSIRSYSLLEHIDKSSPFMS